MSLAVVVRLILLALLLLAELLGLTLAFDSHVIRGDGFLNALLANSSLAPQLVIVLVGALLIQGQVRHHPAWTSLLVAIRGHRGWPISLAFQALAFGALWLVSRQVFRRDVEPAAVLMATWWFCVAATGLTWLAAVAPLQDWGHSIWRSKFLLGIAAAVGLAAMVSGWAAQLLWAPLSFLTFRTTSVLLHPWFTDIEFDAASRVISTPRFGIEIAPACSGYEGMGLALVFLSLFLWSFRDRLRFPQALVLIPAGVTIIWLLNSVRIATLFVIGDQISSSMALGGFHSQAGWLVFLAVTLGLAWIALRIPWLAQTEPPTEERSVILDTPEDAPPVVAFLMPFFVLMLSSIVVASVTVGLDRGYFVKVLAVGIAVWCCRSSYGRWSVDGWFPATLCGGGVFLLWCVLEQPDPETGDRLARSVADLPTWERVCWLGFRVIGSVITVPIAEELAFRGYLMRRIVQRDFAQVPWSHCGWLSMSISSLLFGLLHERMLAGVLAGVAYGWLARRTAGVSAPILAHGITNGLIAVAVLCGNAWWLWV